ncbi:TLP18.3, Psb32 and MOLO-1 founding protein of phosphatase [Oryzisolibacter propanilivorax]|uniref:TLP18.3, Psb32 and MOLO-1 founding protein of phosphatase n=1 Tax=Oryzisolibacter propanilivorax TaxID=1527607 RepID=A0A1G9VQW7_9BURK|nr:TPM domain-containing protein [Oryzisolibacter propanilivorax]SDM74493.1 TLP18.3, Psb32 and MOLO-1 founding protein of phosphatase [Oryzisolibacter propanilivorax]
MDSSAPSSSATRLPARGLLARLGRLARHRWADARLGAALPPDLLERLGARVAASERRHGGQVRICIEGGLPLSYIWRAAIVRERAIAQFGKLRVWDTEHNNGVLVYLLLAERAIEIVADRALARAVPPETWATLAGHMAEAFRAGRFEDGLTQALSEVSALLVAHFPLEGDAVGQPNELPDAPVLGRGWGLR